MTHNVYQLCEGWAFIVVCTTLVEKLISGLQFKFNPLAQLLQNCCCAFVLFTPDFYTSELLFLQVQFFFF